MVSSQVNQQSQWIAITYSNLNADFARLAHHRFAALTTYFGYAVLVIFGHTRDFFGNLFRQSRYLATIPPKVCKHLVMSSVNFQLCFTTGLCAIVEIMGKFLHQKIVSQDSRLLESRCVQLPWC
jgi:hypothetical protein